MLGLQVGAPLDRKLEGLAGLLQDFDGFGVGEPLEVLLDDRLETVEHRLVDPLVEELHVFVAIGEHVADDPLQKPLGERHVVGELEERRFGLDHPELGQVPRGVGVLRAKRRAERVDLAERSGVDLAFELP